MNEQERALVFLLGCIPARLALAVAPLYLSAASYVPLAIATAAMATGFLYLFVSGGRRTAAEAGGKVWWTGLRLYHGLSYACASIYLFMGSRLAAIPLMADTATGLAVYISHIYGIKSFEVAMRA